MLKGQLLRLILWKIIFMSMRTAKSQIRAFSVLWRNHWILQNAWIESKDPDNTLRVCRLIWIGVFCTIEGTCFALFSLCFATVWCLRHILSIYFLQYMLTWCIYEPAHEKETLLFSGLCFFKCACAAPCLEFRYALLAWSVLKVSTTCLRKAKTPARLCLHILCF